MIMEQFSIEVKVQPEIIKNRNMYFWCILKNTSGSISNCGHGWSESVEIAVTDAHAFYKNTVESVHNQA